MRLAIHAPNLGLTLPDQPFGKDVANRGFYTALAAMAALSRSASARRSSRRYPSAAAVWSCTWCGPPQSFVAQQTDAAAQAGTLLRGQPYLSELAWERGHRHGHQAYSLVGMIHTLAPPKVRELIGEVLLAPVQPWDALICTSPCGASVPRGLVGSLAGAPQPAFRWNPRAAAPVAPAAVGRRSSGFA